MKQRKFAGTIPVRRYNPAKVRAKQEGRAGLWAQGGNSFFDNSRELETIDPTAHEEEMTKQQRALSPLREKGKGRVIV